MVKSNAAGAEISSAQRLLKRRLKQLLMKHKHSRTSHSSRQRLTGAGRPGGQAPPDELNRCPVFGLGGFDVDTGIRDMWIK